MSALAVLLAAVGTTDLLPRWRWAGGIAVAVAGSLAMGFGWHGLWVSALVGLVCGMWDLGERKGSILGTVALVVAALALVACSGVLHVTEVPLQAWYDDLRIDALDDVAVEYAALAVGVMLFLATAANSIVRQVLAASGPRVMAAEQTIKGGRFLGPLERWLIFALAVGGHVGTVVVVVAAKGILRFPEISRSKPDGMDAEYVLIGSFVSWSLALMFVPLF